MENSLVAWRTPQPGRGVIRPAGLPPAACLELPLRKRDGAVFRSADAYGHPGTASGPFWTTGGRYFDGVDDKITIPHSAALIPGLASFWVSAWVRLLAKDVEQCVASKYKLPATAGFHGMWIPVSNKPVAYIAASGSTYQTRGSTVALTTTEPAHLVCHFDRPRNMAHVYINGEAADGALNNAGGFSAASDISTPADLTLGYHVNAAAPYAHMVLGEFAVYPGDVTPQQVQACYLAAKGAYR